MTGYAEVSSRTAVRCVMVRRSSPQVISRGRPSNQSVRTRTGTGSTRVKAIGRLFSLPSAGGPGTVIGSGMASSGALGRPEHLFDVTTVDRTDVRVNPR